MENRIRFKTILTKPLDYGFVVLPNIHVMTMMAFRFVLFADLPQFLRLVLQAVFSVSVVVGISSCARYQHIPPYDDVSTPPPPDYSLLEFWAAHPEKLDSSDRYPGKAAAISDLNAPVDVFFLHPTTYTKQKKLKQCNADLRDQNVNHKTDRTAILFQASAFHNGTRIFAPRYRQAHFNNYFTREKETALSAFALAYEDVANAFEYYLKHYNEGRPFIIAAHSQGTTHAIPLIKNKIDGKALQEKLVAAYLVGMPVQTDTFAFIRPCENPDQTGCFTSWRTFKRGTEMVHEEGLPISVTNPISWSLSTDFVAKEENQPSLLRDFDVVYPKLVDAQVNASILWVTKPKFKGSFFLRTNNYHPADINFFYFSIYENVANRIQHYFSHK